MGLSHGNGSLLRQAPSDGGNAWRGSPSPTRLPTGTQCLAAGVHTSGGDLEWKAGHGGTIRGPHCFDRGPTRPPQLNGKDSFQWPALKTATQLLGQFIGLETVMHGLFCGRTPFFHQLGEGLIDGDHALK